MTCILVVEHDGDLRDMLVEFLSDAGFQILQTATGDAAVESLELASLQLIVTDVNLPGRLNGIDLASTARKSRPEIPVIFISGRPWMREEAHALDNSTVFLQKPFRFGNLISAIQRLATSI